MKGKESQAQDAEAVTAQAVANSSLFTLHLKT